MSRYVMQRSIKSEVGKLAWFDAETFDDLDRAKGRVESEQETARFRAREWDQPVQRIRLVDLAPATTPGKPSSASEGVGM